MYYAESQSTPLVASETPGALQRKWKVPARFPLCPPPSVETPLETYFERLYIGDVAVISRLSDTTVGDTAMSPDGKSIFILGEFEEGSPKPWSLIEITFEDGYFVHESLGMFFTREGVEKEFTLAQGLPWEGGDTFDDFCR